jgi:hypothetical protein
LARSELLELVRRVKPAVLGLSEEAEALATGFVQLGMVPARFRRDGLHLAIAMAEGMDALVSWNFRHIVRVKTRRVVSAASTLGGYKDLDICTPVELADDAEE